MIKLLDLPNLSRKDMQIAIEVLIKDLDYNFPGLLEDILKDNITKDMMAPYYSSWSKKMKKGKHTKVRYLNKVTNDIMKGIMAHAGKHISLQSADSVYSYKAGVKTADLASQFVGMTSILSLDITDYYYCITRKMIKELYYQFFKGCRFNTVLTERFRDERDSVPTILSNIMSVVFTGPDSRPQNMAVTDDNVLLQGSPHAGMIANAALYDLDNQFEEWASKKGYIYARYSDNFYIGSKDTVIPKDDINEAISMVEDFDIADIKTFKIKRKKVKLMTSNMHQRVLGIVVNEKMNIGKLTERYLNSRIANLSIRIKDILKSMDVSHVKAMNNISLLKKNELAEIKGLISYIGGFNRDKYESYIKYYNILEFELSSISSYITKSLSVVMFDDWNGIDFKTSHIPSLVFRTNSEGGKTLFKKFLSNIDKGVVGYGGPGFVVVPIVLPYSKIKIFDQIYYETCINVRGEYCASSRSFSKLDGHDSLSSNHVNRVLMYNSDHPEGLFDLSMCELQNNLMNSKLKTPVISNKKFDDMYGVFNAIWKIRKDIIGSYTIEMLK